MPALVSHDDAEMNGLNNFRGFLSKSGYMPFSSSSSSLYLSSFSLSLSLPSLFQDFYTFTIPSMKDNRISVGGSCLNDSSVLTISWLNETNFTAMFYFSKVC